MKTLDIVIEEPGDPSVGIWSRTWMIRDVCLDENERDEIRKATEEYFERYISEENVSVMFSDEIKAMNEEMEKDLKE